MNLSYIYIYIFIYIDKGVKSGEDSKNLSKLKDQVDAFLDRITDPANNKHWKYPKGGNMESVAPLNSQHFRHQKYRNHTTNVSTNNVGLVGVKHKAKKSNANSGNPAYV